MLLPSEQREQGSSLRSALGAAQQLFVPLYIVTYNPLLHDIIQAMRIGGRFFHDD